VLNAVVVGDQRVRVGSGKSARGAQVLELAADEQQTDVGFEAGAGSREMTGDVLATSVPHTTSGIGPFFGPSPTVPWPTASIM